MRCLERLIFLAAVLLMVELWVMERQQPCLRWGEGVSVWGAGADGLTYYGAPCLERAP